MTSDYWPLEPSVPVQAIAADPEPAEMALVPQSAVVEAVAGNLNTVFGNSIDLNMWEDGPPTGDYFTSQMLSTYFAGGLSDVYEWDDDLDPPSKPKNGYFISALSNGTNTGVLREHVLRLNHTVTCEKTGDSYSTPTCPGKNPYYESLFSSDMYASLDPRIDISGFK